MNTLIPVVVAVDITDDCVGDGNDDDGDGDGAITKLPVLVLPTVLLLASITCRV